MMWTKSTDVMFRRLCKKINDMMSESFCATFTAVFILSVTTAQETKTRIYLWDGIAKMTWLKMKLIFTQKLCSRSLFSILLKHSLIELVYIQENLSL
jgi:hypothetical protein